MTRIAVIGAGLSGLVAARQLSHDHEVTIFEKSRGVGGRMATRYAGKHEFDHGAQFFTALSPTFKSFLQPLIEKRIVAIWQARIAKLGRGRANVLQQWDDALPHYVGVPRMNEIGKSLAVDNDVRLQTSVARLECNDNKWLLFDREQCLLGDFDWVVITAPAPQAAKLVPETSTIRQHCDSARMRACLALMLGFELSLDLPWQAANVLRADISWLSVNNSKPGRADSSCLVVHSTNDWADAHIDDSEESIVSHLLAELSAVTSIRSDTATFCALHRWRYANVDAQDGPEFCIDAELRLAACGDWFINGRIEAAFTSALAMSSSLSKQWLI